MDNIIWKGETEMVQLMKRRCTNALVRRGERLAIVDMRRDRGRPKY